MLAPTLSLQSQVAYTNDPILAPNSSWYVEGVLNVPIYDGGIASATAKDARATAEQARQTLVLTRLNALVVAQIEEPDDQMLEGVLRKFFGERSIRPSDDVYPYLIRRIERSIPAAKDVVSRLDDLAATGQREITRALARQILEQEDSTLDLFD